MRQILAKAVGAFEVRRSFQRILQEVPVKGDVVVVTRHGEPIAAVTSKGQVTIPVAVRRHLGITTHDKVAFIIEDDQVRVAPVGKSVVARTAGLLKGDQPALTPQQDNDVFEQAMAEDAEGLTGS